MLGKISAKDFAGRCGSHHPRVTVDALLQLELVKNAFVECVFYIGKILQILKFLTLHSLRSLVDRHYDWPEEEPTSLDILN